MSLKDLAKKLYPAFIKNFSATPCRLFLSATNMKERAVIRHAVGDNPEKVWAAALNALQDALKIKGGMNPTILRADWVTASETVTWAECLERIKAKRRNFFRKGIALDKNFNLAFTEQELNANLILFTEEKRNGEFQADKAAAYCKRRFDCNFPKLVDADEVEIFDTAGIFIQEEMPEPLMITAEGRRAVAIDDKEFFLKLVKKGSNYLSRQCGKSGKFIYGVYPCDDSKVPSYNSLLHFSTLYSMMEVYENFGKAGDATLGKAISRGLEYGIEKFVFNRTFPDGQDASYIEDKKQLKLGASGMALLALTKWTKIQSTKKYLPLMNSLARGIFYLQKQNGSFVHVLNAENFTVKDEFRTQTYDSEAILGLLRLYTITKDERLLESAERAFDYFIANDYSKNRDHWLSLAANEITVYRPTKKIFRFALNNCLPYLSTIRDRETSSPSFMMLILSTKKMLYRMKTMSEMSKLLERVDWKIFREALNRRAEKILDGYFFPEVAMYFQNPERIVGSFFVRQEKFRIRIDDVKDNLSNFVAYVKNLDTEIYSA